LSMGSSSNLGTWGEMVGFGKRNLQLYGDLMAKNVIADSRLSKEEQERKRLSFWMCQNPGRTDSGGPPGGGGATTKSSR